MDEKSIDLGEMTNDEREWRTLKAAERGFLETKTNGDMEWRFVERFEQDHQWLMYDVCCCYAVSSADPSRKQFHSKA